MLRNGYDAAPKELLSRFMGIDLGDPGALIDSEVRVVGEWLDPPAP